MSDLPAIAREIAYSGHTTDEAYADLITAALLSARNEALDEATMAVLSLKGNTLTDEEAAILLRVVMTIRALKHGGK